MSEQTAIQQTSGSGMKVLDRNALKYIVIVAMVIDHIAWAFPEQLGSTLCAVMHFIGRLTGPTMAFFLAEGYKYTSDKGRYQARLGIFALISWIPFVFFEISPNIMENLAMFFLQSVIFTLFLGITALRIWESQKTPEAVKILAIIGLCIFSIIGDWPIMDVLGPFFLYVFRNNKPARYVSVGLVYGFFNLITFLGPDGNGGWTMDFAGKWYNFGILLVPVMIWLFYNGKGGKKSAFNKWFFYIFYPAHLVVLGILKMIILK